MTTKDSTMRLSMLRNHSIRDILVTYQPNKMTPVEENIDKTISAHAVTLITTSNLYLMIYRFVYKILCKTFDI